jgi:hypothetical protein
MSDYTDLQEQLKACEKEMVAQAHRGDDWKEKAIKYRNLFDAAAKNAEVAQANCDHYEDKFLKALDALAFYANKQNWKYDDIGSMLNPQSMKPIDSDYGDIASKALIELGKEEE